MLVEELVFVMLSTFLVACLTLVWIVNLTNCSIIISKNLDPHWRVTKNVQRKLSLNGDNWFRFALLISSVFWEAGRQVGIENWLALQEKWQRKQLLIWKNKFAHNQKKNVFIESWCLLIIFRSTRTFVCISSATLVFGFVATIWRVKIMILQKKMKNEKWKINSNKQSIK